MATNALEPESELDEIIAEFMDEWDGGVGREPESFIARHPILAHRTMLREEFLKFVRDNGGFRRLMAGTNGDSANSFKHDTHLTRGTSVAGFQIVRLLGSGGMGTVYHAVEQDTGQPVALKLLRRGELAGRPAQIRFGREAMAIESLNHANIVPLIESGIADGFPYLAMQLIEGVTFAELVTKQLEDAEDSATIDEAVDSAPSETADATLAPSQNRRSEADVVLRRFGRGPGYFRWVASMTADIADALYYAHRLGVVHRDLKPSNLLVDTDGKPWLTDFGLAQLGDDQTQLTESGEVMGTPAYMSPEQASGSNRQVDFRTDIYSLGATLYELATLQRPFTGKRNKILLEVVNGQAPLPSRKRPDIPPGLEAIIVKAMNPAPESRYASAVEMATDLRRFIDGERPKARIPGRRDQLYRWIEREPATAAGIAGLTLGMLIAVILVTAVLWKNSQVIREKNDELEKLLADRSAANLELIRVSKEWRRDAYTADMNTGFDRYRDADVERVAQLLEQYWEDGINEDLRGFEWYLLNDLILAPDSQLIHQHTAAATDARYIPSENAVISVGHAGVAAISPLSGSAGQTSRQFDIGGQLDAVAVDPAGEFFVTGSNVVQGPNRVAVRSLRDGKILSQLTNHATTVESAAVSSNSQWIATTERYENIRVHDRQGQLLKTLKTGARHKSVQFVPGGSTLFGLMRRPDNTQFLRAWQAPTFRPQFDIEQYSPLAFCISGDGRWLSHIWRTGVQLFDLQRQEQAAAMKSIAGNAACTALSHDGSVLAVGCDLGTVYLWFVDQQRGDGDSLLRYRVFQAASESITSVTFVPPSTSDGNGATDLALKPRLLTTSHDGSVRCWEIDQCRPNLMDGQAQASDGSNLQTRFVCPAPTDPNRLYVHTSDSQLVCINLLDHTIDQIGRCPTHENDAMTVTRDERFLITGTEGGVEVWDITRGESVDLVAKSVPGRFVSGIALCDKEEQLVVSYSDRLDRYAFDGVTGKLSETPLKTTLLPSDNAKQLLSNPQGGWLVLANQAVYRYDNDQTGTLLTSERLIGTYTHAELSGSGRYLALGRSDGSIQMVDLQDPDLTRTTYRSHADSVWDAAFIEDDRTLVTCALDGSIRFWDLATGRDKGTMHLNGASPWHLHFYAGDRGMIVGGPSRRLQYWEPDWNAIDAAYEARH